MPDDKLWVSPQSRPPVRYLMLGAIEARLRAMEAEVAALVRKVRELEAERDAR